jgi:hypothetical protein
MSNCDEVLLKRLRAVLREVNAQSQLFPKAAIEDTIDIPDDEVVLLILNAADRRVAALESQLAAIEINPATSSTSIANDPAAVLKKSGIASDEDAEAESDNNGRHNKRPVTTKTNGSSVSHLRPPVQRSTSALSLPRTRGATVSSTSSNNNNSNGGGAIVASNVPKMEIIGAGLSSAVVGRVASFVVRFVAADGKLKHVANKAPTAIFHTPDGVDVAANVTKCRDGSFALSYGVPATANVDAAGTLDVFINGQRSKNSPYSIQLSARRAT